MNIENKKTHVISIIEKILDKYNNMHGEIVVAEGCNILWHNIFSYSDAPYQANINSEYLIGSITKQFTAAAVLKALDENTTENIRDVLHAPISSLFFIDWKNIFDRKPPVWANMVSIHHLLTHTSGIEKKNETALQSKLESNPGEKFCYLNAGYVFLGKIIESIVKYPVEKYFKEKLFKPAGMNNTYFPIPNQHECTLFRV